jgi:hypothetical protein
MFDQSYQVGLAAHSRVVCTRIGKNCVCIEQGAKEALNYPGILRFVVREQLRNR